MDADQLREVEQDLFDKFQDEFDKLFGGQEQNIRELHAKELGKRISEKGDAIDGAAK